MIYMHDLHIQLLVPVGDSSLTTVAVLMMCSLGEIRLFSVTVSIATIKHNYFLFLVGLDIVFNIPFKIIIFSKTL